MSHIAYVPIVITQDPRFHLFCEGGIFSAHALTLVGTKPTHYIRNNVVNVLKFISFILQFNNT